MAIGKLTAGKDFLIQNRVAGSDTPLYPITKTANVVNSDGKTVDELIASCAPKEHGNHVPDIGSEVMSSLKFLRNDNTWAEIQSASTTQQGVVQLSDDITTDDSTVAATAKAVKLLNDKIAAISTEISGDFVTKDQMGAASGVATLDENGKVVSTQLPSFVDDVIDVEMDPSLSSAKDEHGTAIKPEGGKIYVDCLGEEPTQKTYRWSGTVYAVISDTIALGETEQTAFDGKRGKEAYDHAHAPHAKVDATKVENSEQNGYVKVDGDEVLVYTHPTGASETNPHNTTAADVGLANVENKSAEEIIDTLTKEKIVEKLSYTPLDETQKATTSQDGVMTKEQVAKLNNCSEISIASEAPTFSGTTGIWFQIIEE